MIRKVYGGDETPLVQCINPILDRWMILWAKSYEEKNGYFFMGDIIEHRPSLQEIKDIIINWYNDNIYQRILSGFTWRDMPIWLSTENQFNYSAAYNIAVDSGGEILPTFKFGTTDNPIYYRFESLEDLKDFFLGFTSYTAKILEVGWKAKDSIDWKAYSDILDNS